MVSYNIAEKIRVELEEMIRNSIRGAQEEGELPPFDVPVVPIEASRDRSHGDFATTVALTLARSARMAPRAIATILAKRISAPCGYVERVEVAGPGFINFFLNRVWLEETLIMIEDAGTAYGTSDFGGGARIQIEFVSANPTGPMNVVNARAGAVGDTLANIFAAAGYQVSREYYINDAGNQVDVLGKSVELRYRQLLGEPVELSPECYQGDYITDLARRALDERGRDIASMSDDERRNFFKSYAVAEILRMQRESLRNFGVEFDVWFSEKTLEDSGADKQVMEILDSKGLLYEKDGAIWFKSTAFGDDKDRVVVKRDGKYTYLLRDLAYHKNKLDRGFDRIIDIWGPDHHGYVARTKAGVQALGYPQDALEVLLLQLVTLYSHGEQVRMSKRAGEFITMDELIQEVGKDAARYFFVMRNIDSHLDFDMELAKEQSQENPVYYIQYAHARLSSIMRQAAELGVKYVPAREANLGLLAEDAEVELIKKLAAFPDEIIAAARDRAPNRIAKYALDLAGMFHSFYNSYRVLSDDRELTAARLVLANATRIVLRNLLGILGVSAPERM
ncbi:MAG TPA: arginine--tRNA ligase [Firmicutes bacterium]|nr:arginine--tRNA ligase [Bacillota bacterium]